MIKTLKWPEVPAGDWEVFFVFKKQLSNLDKTIKRKWVGKWKRQEDVDITATGSFWLMESVNTDFGEKNILKHYQHWFGGGGGGCLLYTSDAADER